MGTDLQMSNVEDSKTTYLFTEAVVTTLLCSNRNTAVFSTERFAFFYRSSHPNPDQGRQQTSVHQHQPRRPVVRKHPCSPGCRGR